MNITDPIFNDETAARKHLEKINWPDGPVCPRCGSINNAAKLKGKSTRPGVYKCRECRKPFTVTVGTLFERSKIPLHKWVLAFHLMAASKKGMSAHQLHRMLGVTYKTAWFMAHRIREAMRETDPEPMGGAGKTVEVDETYVGKGKNYVFDNERGWRRLGGSSGRMVVMAIVERGGRVRSQHIPNIRANTLKKALWTQLDRGSHLITDEAMHYRRLGLRYITHRRVNHSIKEYVRGPVYTNTIENYFSIFKRGITGVYQHVSAKHLKRYTCEFDFRYNTRKLDDHERTDIALQGIAGKRLTYRRIDYGQESHASIN